MLVTTQALPMIVFHLILLEELAEESTTKKHEHFSDCYHVQPVTLETTGAWGPATNKWQVYFLWAIINNLPNNCILNKYSSVLSFSRDNNRPPSSSAAVKVPSGDFEPRDCQSTERTPLQTFYIL
jgi:hypothetical protein